MRRFDPTRSSADIGGHAAACHRFQATGPAPFPRARNRTARLILDRDALTLRSTGYRGGSASAARLLIAGAAPGNASQRFIDRKLGSVGAATVTGRHITLLSSFDSATASPGSIRAHRGALEGRALG